MAPPLSNRERERVILPEFLAKLGSDGAGWTWQQRERPDFFCERGVERIGIEVTEMLPDLGEERALEAGIAEIIRENVRRVVEAHDGRGAIIDGHLRESVRPRDRTEVARALAAHLEQHGAALSTDRGAINVPFHFAQGAVSHIERMDDLGEVTLLAGMNHQMMDTARDAAWIESELVATVTKKVQVGERYDRTRPLWLVVRNPYTHLPSVSDATRGQLSAVNGDMFRRVYVFNRKASDPIDGNTPQPIVLTALALDRRAR